MQSQFHYVRLDDPEESLKSPALNALLKSGWIIRASFIGEREGRPCLVLMLCLPSRLSDQAFDVFERMTQVVTVLLLLCLVIMEISKWNQAGLI